MLKKYNCTQMPEFELSSNDLILDLADIGLGIGFLPDYMLKNRNTDLKILDAEFEIPGRQLVLASNSENTVLLQAFVNYFI